MTFTLYPNMSSLIDHYDAWIVDLWGVIHDGQTLYPGVLECLTKIKEHNKSILFLSNAPRRAVRAKKVLDKLGIPKNLYLDIITSGEVTFDYINSRNHAFGKNFVIIGPDKDDDLLDGLSDYQRITDFKNADFVIVTGFDEDNSTIEDVMPEINASFQYKLPMICANPDFEVVRQTGERALCAGVIAHHYQAMGGEVLFFGKPYKSVYEKCFTLLKAHGCHKIAATGDNLETDIIGANQLNIDSYLVTGGILSQSLNIQPGELPNTEKLHTLFIKYDIMPTGVVPAFIW
jgi:HAD superfamily hydrolase (TIGR01459 family)